MAEKLLVNKPKDLVEATPEEMEKVEKAIVSEEKKERISNPLKGKMSGEKNPMYGKPGTCGFLGKTHTEESKQKMREAKKKRK